MLQPLSMASRQDSSLQYRAFHSRSLRACQPSRISSGSASIKRLASKVFASQSSSTPSWRVLRSSHRPLRAFMRRAMSVTAAQNSCWSNGDAGSGARVSVSAMGMTLARMKDRRSAPAGAAPSPVEPPEAFPPPTGRSAPLPWPSCSAAERKNKAFWAGVIDLWKTS
jgi:hypothetical protein